MKGSVLPGFSLSFGITITYVTILILLPLGALFLEAADVSAAQVAATLGSRRVLSALRLSVLASVSAAGINVLIGTLLAWVLVRYEFPGKRVANSLIDLPFALPTAVAGISLTTLYGPTGWLGRPLLDWGIKVAYAPMGVVLALIFVGLPFVVRSIQPVLADLEPELEEAAAVLGAGSWRTFFSVILPPIFPAILTGFSLAIARGLGEYGSIVFISGNMPNRTEILPLLIMTKLEQFDVHGAVVLALVMLGVSLALLFSTNALHHRIVARRRGRIQ